MREDTVSRFNCLIGEDIELTSILSSEPIPIEADPTQIEQLILNLAANARDAMPGGGRITIKISDISHNDELMKQVPDEMTTDSLLLEFSDSGSGIHDEIKNHLFEPFFTTKEVGKGTGLGLSTCYAIVKRFGGQIRVEGRIGEGTTFKIFLPISHESIAVGNSSNSCLPTVNSCETVLLAEDDLSVRNTIAEMLEDQGYEVISAAFGSDALRLAETFQGPIDILLTDVIMPIMGGQELAEKFRLLRPDAATIYISGYPGLTMFQNGVVGESESSFIQKPVTPMALNAKLRAVLG